MISLFICGVLSLTAPNGTQVHILKQNIFSVRPASSGDHANARTIIQSVTGPASQSVRETPEQVLSLLRSNDCN